VVSATPWLLYTWERDQVPIVQEAGWGSGTGMEDLSPTGV